MSVSRIDKREHQVAPCGCSPQSCQTVAGGRSASGDLRYAGGAEPTQKGSQEAVLQIKHLAPLQGAENFFALTGGIAVLLRAPAQPPATIWHAFSVQMRFRVSHFTFHASLMKIPGLRTSYDKVGGLVFFGRMLDKIRLHAQGKLPADYNLGKGMDGRCARFLHVEYPKIAERTLQGGTDEEILEWSFQHGRRPNDEEILVWNAFMSKRGWRDEASEGLAEEKRKRGFANRDDIQTYFDFHKADEES